MTITTRITVLGAKPSHSTKTIVQHVYTILQVLALMFIIPGALIIADVEYLNKEVMPLLKQLSYGGSNLADVADGLAVTMLVIGFIIGGLALIGICGAVKKYKTCLCVVSFG